MRSCTSCREHTLFFFRFFLAVGEAVDPPFPPSSSLLPFQRRNAIVSSLSLPLSPVKQFSPPPASYPCPWLHRTLSRRFRRTNHQEHPWRWPHQSPARERHGGMLLQLHAIFSLPTPDAPNAASQPARDVGPLAAGWPEKERERDFQESRRCCQKYSRLITPPPLYYSTHEVRIRYILTDARRPSR